MNQHQGNTQTTETETGVTTTATRPTFGAQFMTSFPASDGLSVGGTRSNWTTNEDNNG